MSSEETSGGTFTTYQPVYSRVFGQSLLVEFVGVACFQFLGGTSRDPVLTPFVNGLALAVLIYMAANISGGHLNPAVSMSALICGYYPVLHSVLYVIVQVGGAIAGALISAGLTPNNELGSGKGPGCFTDDSVDNSISNAQMFGWECIMTFILISTVYACGIAKPGHGSFTPLAVGLSLLACAGTGGIYTGAALNPARVLGPAIVFECGWDVAWIYVLAQLTGGMLACVVFATVSGWGPLYPPESMRKFKLKRAEAIYMLLTGNPPRRLRKNAALVAEVTNSPYVHPEGDARVDDAHRDQAKETSPSDKV